MKYYLSKSGELELNGNNKYLEIEDKKLKTKLSDTDCVLAIAMLVIGFMYWNLVCLSNKGLGVVVFTFVLCFISLYYFKQKGVSQNKKSILWLAILLGASTQFVIFDGYIAKNINLLFISICFIYWVAKSNRNCIEDNISFYIIWDLINNSFIIPFSNFTYEFMGIKCGLSKNKHSKNIQYIAIGLVIVFPVMIFVINQLSNADAAFEAAIEGIYNLISLGTILEYGIQFILGFPVACYLFGLIFVNVNINNEECQEKEKLKRFSKEISISPKLTVYTVLTVFNLIYIIFFITQITYLLSAFDNVLPSGFTYAEYARRGFFELCKVSSINLLLLTLSHVFIKKDTEWSIPNMLRLQTAILSIMTIGLIVTALSKMYMYIQSYGLTQLRVYTTWSMIMLLIIFTVVLLRQIFRFNATRIVIVSSIIGILTLSFGNVDGNIAKYNIENYENGNLEKIDYNMLFTLSDAAMPQIYEHYKKIENEEIRYMVYNRIGYESISIQDKSIGDYITDFNMQSYKAEMLRNELRDNGVELNMIDTI